MKGRIATTILALCLVGGNTSSCNISPPPPQEEVDIVAGVREEIPEEIELVEQIDDDTYLFRSCVRDLEFEVDVEPARDPMFGSYLGGYVYWNHYEALVYNLYVDRIEELIAEHGFEIGEIDTYDIPAYETISIFAHHPLEDEDIENINDFLSDLREIAREEQQYHIGDYIFQFNVEFFGYEDVTNTPGYPETIEKSYEAGVITADSSDEDLDIILFNAGPSIRSNMRAYINGILVIVDEEEVYSDYTSYDPGDTVDYCMSSPDDPEPVSTETDDVSGG
ncbi:MAG: hypothetical protein J5696_05675 [Lachnospiraceae bacterium]|nr:hypothetical protein [Lachnospiraceae bacterium]